MWNLQPSNVVCQKKKNVQDHARHIYNVVNARPLIHNLKPWHPTHSLSKWTNKYTHCNQSLNHSKIIETEARIAHENNVLLNKMMDIQTKKNNSLNLRVKTSLRDNLRKREKRIVNIENEGLLKRLQSANSLYGRKWWVQKDSEQQKYRENILKKTSKECRDIIKLELNDDYGQLARRQLRKSMSAKSMRLQRTSTAAQQQQQQRPQTQGDYDNLYY